MSDSYLELCSKENQLILTRIARNRIPPKLQAKLDPDDLVQSTLKRAIEKYPKQQLIRDKTAWLVKLLEHALVDKIRFYKCRKRNIDCEQNPSALEHFSRGFNDLGGAALELQKTPSSHASKNENDARIHSALKQLPEPQRIVIVYLWLEGLTIGEIAKRRGISEYCVSKLKSAGEKSLANIIDHL